MKDNDIRSFFNSKQISKTNTNNMQTPTPIINIQEKQPTPKKASEKHPQSKKRKCADV
jgi:hypothetical protein